MAGLKNETGKQSVPLSGDDDGDGDDYFKFWNYSETWPAKLISYDSVSLFSLIL